MLKHKGEKAAALSVADTEQQKQRPQGSQGLVFQETERVQLSSWLRGRGSMTPKASAFVECSGESRSTLSHFSPGFIISSVYSVYVYVHTYTYAGQKLILAACLSSVF